MYSAIIGLASSAVQMYTSYKQQKEAKEQKANIIKPGVPSHATKYVMEAEDARERSQEAYREGAELSRRGSTRMQQQEVELASQARTPSESFGLISASNTRRMDRDLNINVTEQQGLASASQIPFQSYMEMAKYENSVDQMHYRDSLNFYNNEIAMAQQGQSQAFGNFVNSAMAIQSDVLTSKYYGKVSEKLDVETELLKKELNPETYGLNKNGDVDTTFKDKDTTSTDISSPEYDFDKIMDTDLDTKTAQAKTMQVEGTGALNSADKKFDEFGKSGTDEEKWSSELSKRAANNILSSIENPIGVATKMPLEQVIKTNLSGIMTYGFTKEEAIALITRSYNNIKK